MEELVSLNWCVIHSLVQRASQDKEVQNEGVSCNERHQRHEKKRRAGWLLTTSRCRR